MGSNRGGVRYVRVSLDKRDQIARLLRTTDMTMILIAARLGVSHKTVSTLNKEFGIREQQPRKSA